MSCLCGEQCVGYAGAQISYESAWSERAYEDTLWSLCRVVGVVGVDRGCRASGGVRHTCAWW